MKKLRTTDDILNDRSMFTAEEASTIHANALTEAKKYWGGKRDGAGRKAQISNNPRNKQIKVSEDVKLAIQYAYNNGIIINIDDVKLLKYLKETGITLNKLQQI